VEAAVPYFGSEDSFMGFAFAGWAQAALPHRRLPDDQPWQLSSERLTFVVEPGRRTASGGKLLHVRVPFWFACPPDPTVPADRALRGDSREIELGGSLRQ
jgi:hypothetical protein